MLKALAKQREDRYEDMGDLLTDLKSISLDPKVSHAATHPPDSKESKKDPALVATRGKSKIEKLLSGPKWRFPVMATIAAIILIAIAVGVGRLADEGTPSSLPISAVDSTVPRSLTFWMTVQKDMRAVLSGESCANGR